MVASQQINVLRELDLVCEKECNGFNRLFATIDVITDEQKLLVALGITGDIKKAEQIEVLTMHVSKDLNWSYGVKKHWFRVEHFDNLIDQKLDRLLVEFNGLSPCATFDFDELGDYRVYGDFFL